MESIFTYACLSSFSSQGRNKRLSETSQSINGEFLTMYICIVAVGQDSSVWDLNRKKIPKPENTILSGPCVFAVAE